MERFKYEATSHCSTKRIAFGKYGGYLKHLEPEQLLEPLFNYFQAEYPGAMEYLEDVIIGNTVGNGGNIARKSLLEAGLKTPFQALLLIDSVAQD